jgi:nitroreductase
MGSTGFAALAETRYSVRSYEPTPVDEASLARVLEAVRIAPTAANRQAFRVVVLATRGRTEELARVYHRPWFSQAPLLLALVSVPGEAWVRPVDGWNAAETDAAIAMTHLVLAATEEGLGTCWVAHFDPGAARELLALPDGWVPYAFTPLGHPAVAPRPDKVRRPMSELVIDRR